jgi:hypothetical protein
MKEQFPQNEPTEEGFSRRQVLGGVLAAGAAALASEIIHEKSDHHLSEERQHAREKLEISGELFETEQKLYSTVYTLSYNQILFYGEDRQIIGEPITVEDIEITDPQTGTKRKISAGERDERGIVKDLNQEWIDLKRVQISQEHNISFDLKKGTPKQTNTIAIVRKAMEADSEVHAQTLVDVAQHYGHQVVQGDDRSRIQYIREEFGEQGLLPEHIVDELASIIPGLAAQESQYNNSALSRTGAKGIFQFQPATWKDLGYEEADILNFKTQVEAVEKHVATSYTFFTEQDQKHPRLSIIKQRFFDNNQQDYEKYFLVPLMINAYNAGNTRVFSVVGNFLTHFDSKDKLPDEIKKEGNNSGYDLFAFMAQYTAQHGEVSGYGRDSSQYFSRVVAMANLV